VIEGFDYEAMEDLAMRAATSICKRVSGSSREDLKQDGIVWMLSHQHKLIEWAEDPDQGYGKTYRSVYHCLLDLAQRDKAIRTGYHPDDNFYYSLPMLKRILPLFYMDTMADMSAELNELDLPDRDAKLDVEAGLKKVPMAIRQKLFAWFHEDRDQTEVVSEIAETNEISYEAARKRWERTIRKLQEAIGGPAPTYHRPRKVISNAAAQALTHNAYDPG